MRRIGVAILPFGNGGVAQLGERLLCKQEVIGSIPFTSTKLVVWWGSRLGKKCYLRPVRLYEPVAGLLIDRVKKRVVRDRGRARSATPSPGR